MIISHPKVIFLTCQIWLRLLKGGSWMVGWLRRPWTSFILFQHCKVWRKCIKVCCSLPCQNNMKLVLSCVMYGTCICVLADQVYGDQEMHSIVRKHCMDYMVKYTSLKTCVIFGDILAVLKMIYIQWKIPCDRLFTLVFFWNVSIGLYLITAIQKKASVKIRSYDILRLMKIRLKSIACLE